MPPYRHGDLETSRPSVFISHSHHDEGYVRAIKTWLDMAGFNTWVFFEKCKHQFNEEIDEAIIGADIFLIVTSENAFNSCEVKKELYTATEHKIEIVYYRLDSATHHHRRGFARHLAGLQWIEADPSCLQKGKLALRLNEIIKSKYPNYNSSASEKLIEKLATEERRAIQIWKDKLWDLRLDKNFRKRSLSERDRDILRLLAGRQNIIVSIDKEDKLVNINKLGFRQTLREVLAKPLLDSLILNILEDKRNQCCIPIRLACNMALTSECLKSNEKRPVLASDLSIADHWLVKCITKVNQSKLAFGTSDIMTEIIADINKAYLPHGSLLRKDKTYSSDDQCIQAGGTELHSKKEPVIEATHHSSADKVAQSASSRGTAERSAFETIQGQTWIIPTFKDLKIVIEDYYLGVLVNKLFLHSIEKEGTSYRFSGERILTFSQTPFRPIAKISVRTDRLRFFQNGCSGYYDMYSELAGIDGKYLASLIDTAESMVEYHSSDSNIPNATGISQHPEMVLEPGYEISSTHADASDSLNPLDSMTENAADSLRPSKRPWPLPLNARISQIISTFHTSNEKLFKTTRYYSSNPAAKIKTLRNHGLHGNNDRRIHVFINTSHFRSKNGILLCDNILSIKDFCEKPIHFDLCDSNGILALEAKASKGVTLDLVISRKPLPDGGTNKSKILRTLRMTNLSDELLRPPNKNLIEVELPELVRHAALAGNQILSSG